MALRQYTVTIETPEAEDDFDYVVSVSRNKAKVDEFVGNLMGIRDRIGDVIILNLEEER